jgi:3-oxoacyl-[acyl-carrier-protein] synthase-3
MTRYTLDSIKLSAIAACVPKEVEDTDSYSLFSVQEAATFRKRVGIDEKRNSKGRLTTSDLCFHAAQKLISDLEWEKESIGLLIFVSQTPDYALPSTAVILQDRLGLSKNTIAFDIRLGCTGWVSGLSMAGSMMKTFKIRRGLLLVGETAILSSYDDPGTYPLMGDAGVATALEYDEQASPIQFNSYSDGSLFQVIIAPDSGARLIADSGRVNANMSIRTQMNGAAIFEFSVSQVLPSIRQLLSDSQMEVSDIDHFVFHQANKLIIESLRKKLEIPHEKCAYSLGQFGNTSSASIPLSIVHQIGSVKGSSKRFFCSSFGVGLSLSNMIFETNDLFCSKLIEI